MRPYLLFILAGLSMALASHFPETLISGFFALCCAALLAHGMKRSARPKRSMFLFSFIFHAIAFYWLPQTLQLFGGLPYLVALLLMGLYCIISSLQFVFCAWVYTRLIRYQFLQSYLLAFPLAWLLSLALFPRVFPWAIVHPMIKVSPVVGIASFFGVMPLCMLMIWWGEFISLSLKSVRLRRLENRAALVAIFSVSLVLLISGYVSNQSVLSEIDKAPSITVGMIQGNLEMKQVGNSQMLSANIAKYKELSELAVKKGADLLVWPESVINFWIPEDVSSMNNPRDNFYPNLKIPLIFGGLSYSRRSAEEIAKFNDSYPELRSTRVAKSYETKRFNAGFGMLPGGDFVGRYYKKALMPFGEFMPFTDYFPWTKKYLPPTGDFSVGELKKPIIFDLENIPVPVRASLLICYEDLIPSLSVEAVREGANILINLTNDAWYGDTVASHQHHLLATWRAVESRRYLLRATNTGFTGIVDPLGNTFKSLPTYTKDFLLADAKLLENRSLYSRLGDIPVYLLCFFIVLLALGKCPAVIK